MSSRERITKDLAFFSFFFSSDRSSKARERKKGTVLDEDYIEKYVNITVLSFPNPGESWTM